MENVDNNAPGPDTALSEIEPAIDHFEQSVREGQHWYVSLLESIGLWKKAEESNNGRRYRYLIAGEAFDWMLLAERVCDTLPGLLPEKERDNFLYRGIPPINLSAERFIELIGFAKYHQYLNYYYGITAEEALVLAVEEEVRKEKRAWGYAHEADATNESYRRIYGTTFSIMLRHFRKENNYPQIKSIELIELKEFAYWRFKYRLKMCEKAKVASDSRKAINWLKEHGVSSYIQRQDIPEFFIDAATEE